MEKTGGFSVCVGQEKHGPCEGMCISAAWGLERIVSNRCLSASLDREGVPGGVLERWEFFVGTLCCFVLAKMRSEILQSSLWC